MLFVTMIPVMLQYHEYTLSKKKRINLQKQMPQFLLIDTNGTFLLCTPGNINQIGLEFF